MHPMGGIFAFGLFGLMAFGIPASWNWWGGRRKPGGLPRPAQMQPDQVKLEQLRPVESGVAEPPAELPHVETISAADRHRPMDHMADTDPQTGLPTQQQFAARLQTAIQQAHDHGASSSLLLISLQGRQKIVALHGAKTGDRALREITLRLQGMLKKSEMLARLGEDDFAVIAEGLAEPAAHRDAANRLAARIVHKIRQPIPANDCELSFGVNIGIALCRSGIAGVSDLVESAASAMHQAKGRPAGFGLAEQWQKAALTADETLEHEVRRALTAGEILPFYQPVIDLATNRICGFEALARWQHPTRGLVPPDEFVPALERTGRIRELTETILTQVCRDAKAWPNDIHVAINVSPFELSDPLLPQRILRITEQEEMAPSRLQIEITETALVHDVPAAIASLETFRRAGIVTSLDDFGTGYASLGQLRQLKFDRLKIDQSFIRGMLDNAECDKIVDAILGLARSLNLQAVAEGIETPAAAASMLSRGCEFGQGYYYSQAVTAQAAGAMLKNGLRRLIAA